LRNLRKRKANGHGIERKKKKGRTVIRGLAKSVANTVGKKAKKIRVT